MATYYIDATNGNDTFTGLKIDSVIDSTASTTTFVDAALTGADDYINGSTFVNVTTGHRSLITDFVAATDTVTIADADASMAGGDTIYILHAWADLDQFTENALSAGDVCVLRRGMTGYDDGTDLNFTSDGTIASPITIEADYDNAWKDFADSAQTYTMVFGSKTHTASANITGIAAGDWIYNTTDGDNPREFAYEVSAVSGTTLTLYLPYKGSTGATKTLKVMPDAPIWNTAAGDFQWNFDTDNHWKIQGLHIRGTDVNGNVEIDSSNNHQFIDCIFTSDSTTVSAYGVLYTDDFYLTILDKCRFITHVSAFRLASDTFGDIILKNCLLGSSSNFVTFASSALSSNFEITDCELQSGVGIGGAMGTLKSKLRNTRISAATEFVSNSTLLESFLIEDHDGVVGANSMRSSYFGNVNAPVIESETTTVRSGGSNKSIKVTPTTNMTTVWDFNKLKIFDLPIYTTTSSKTYTVYFKTNDSGEWTADPTASELWIELEAWGHATNNFRKITKSTGVIDFNGSTSWQSLTVTVAPAQVGVAYLRCWYAKTKEASKSNVFYVDPIPVIS